MCTAAYVECEQLCLNAALEHALAHGTVHLVTRTPAQYGIAQHSTARTRGKTHDSTEQCA